MKKNIIQYEKYVFDYKEEMVAGGGGDCSYLSAGGGGSLQ